MSTFESRSAVRPFLVDEHIVKLDNLHFILYHKHIKTQNSQAFLILVILE